MSAGFLLLIGFFIGIRHALEADHIAAVASLTSRQISLRHALQQGYWWGIGHTLTLLGVGGTVLWLNTVVPSQFVHWLELGVGAMLLVLGFDVLSQLRREQTHSSTPHSAENKMPLPGHLHQVEITTTTNPYTSPQDKGTNHFVLRPLLVGLVHGMAGSAALVMLTLQTMSSSQLGLLYVALFGLGSILGMTLLAVIISFPLRYSVQYATGLHFMLRAGIGLSTIIVGLVTILKQGSLAT